MFHEISRIKRAKNGEKLYFIKNCLIIRETILNFPMIFCILYKYFGKSGILLF